MLVNRHNLRFEWIEKDPVTNAQRVLEALRAGAKTSHEVARRTGLPIRFASAYIAKQIRKGRVRVARRIYPGFAAGRSTNICELIEDPCTSAKTADTM